MPAPGALDNRAQVLESWFPAELAFDLFRGRDQSRRVARTPRFFNDRDFPPTHLATDVDDFTDARAAAGSEIVVRALFRAERENMRAREIEDVNVIPDAGAIRSLVVGAVNFDVRFLAERDLEDVRDEMRLAAVIFAKLRGRPGGVEVA